MSCPAPNVCLPQVRGLAGLVIDVFGATSAMSMDQGGSTEMWIKAFADTNNGIVSDSSNMSGDGPSGGRSIANGLFVQTVS